MVRNSIYTTVRYNKVAERINRYEGLLLVCLKLFKLDESQRILEMIEDNRIIGYTTPMVLEEITFKRIYSKINEALNTTNIWRIREALKLDEKIRSECIKLLKKLCNI